MTMNKVAVVVDENFGGAVVPLLADHDVWMVEAEGNRAAIASVWTAPEPVQTGPARRASLTSFKKASATERADETLEGIFDTLSEHHPNWTELLFIGADPTPVLLAAIRAVASVHVERVPAGVLIRRQVARE